MAASSTDTFIKVGEGTATTLASPGYTIGGASATVVSTTNWPTDTGVIFAIDVAEIINGEQVQVAGTYTEYEGVVSGATSITSVALVAGTPQNYSAGALTRVYIPLSSEVQNRMVDGLLVQHAQDGTHTDVTATSVATDTITEKTAAAGVTIDGLLIKDNKLATADSVVTSNITDDAVNAAKMQYGMVRNRQGGASGDATWQTTGTTNVDTTAKSVFFQAGSAVTSSGTVVITFPTAFTYAPLVFATVASASAANCFVRVTAQTTANATLTVITDGGSLGAAENVSWLAIGQ